MRANTMSKQIATAATTLSLVLLMTFANLASGAGRIHTARPRGKIAVVGAKLAPARLVAAGDRIQRVLELRTGGRGRVTLIAAAKAHSPLADTGVGLRLRVDACSTTWRSGSHGGG